MARNKAAKFRLLLAGGLSALLIFCLAFSWLTRDAMSAMPPVRTSNLVDLRPWQTAEALAALVASSEEAEFARAAQHLADHEVDQAFASALREATLRRPTITGEALEISKKVTSLKALVADDQARVKALTAHDPDDDLDVAKAQLELDTDQLTEAQQDLARAGGDDRGRLQQELAAHEASMGKYDAKVAAQADTVPAVTQMRGTVAADVYAWFRERSRGALLKTAVADANAAAKALTAKHDQLEHLSSAPEGAEKSARLASLGNQNTRSQLLAIYDDRIATQRQLASVYTQWGEQVALKHRMTAHALAQAVALIAFILICIIAFDTLAGRLAERPGLDRRRAQTLSTILKLGIQLIGVILIVLVIFGTPNQTPTILGLTTAGLTVVLQDFIISFIGWFVLMGKNGIRIGDWVEINGVSGEVVSVGLFRTTLLETGGASEKGRPTGRTITLLNSFAIKGQYFNYSTSGQWMWDEIRITVPPERDLHSTLGEVRKEVAEETAKNFQMAAEEWTRIDRTFTAEPSVDMRPGSSGIDLVVRYVTRATERFELRNRLYQRLLDLLHKPAARGSFTG